MYDYNIVFDFGNFGKKRILKQKSHNYGLREV